MILKDIICPILNSFWIYFNQITWYVAERLSDSVIKLYHEKADEKQESIFLEKFMKCKKRNLSLDPEESDEHLPKKVKKGKQAAEEFIIEKILNFKYECGNKYFFVKWKGWPDSENTWEPIENLNNCPAIVRDFLDKQEFKYCDKFENLKEEISFGDLLSENSLIERLPEVETAELAKLKETLILKLLCMLYLKEDDEFLAGDLVQETRSVLQLYVLTRKRCKQLMTLKAWEEHVNQVDKSKKLAVENNTDLAGPPDTFTYINQSIPGAGVTIPDDPPIGCDCTACNCRSKSCCGMQAGLFAYTTKKTLRVAPGTPIYECNKACKCSSECSNRVVQGGRNVKLTVFRTANGCGWGVRSEQRIRQGQFICQYVGEVITFEEAEKRGREYDANGLTYLFDLDFNSCENPYVVDAAHLGNVSHFINHSCDPNLGVWAVWADCLDPNLPMLALFATRDIEAGEEICFDYLQKSSDNDESDINIPSVSRESTADDDDISVANGSDTGRAGSPMTPVKFTANMSSASPVKTRFEVQQQNMAMLRNRTECKCGALKCRKYLF